MSRVPVIIRADILGYCMGVRRAVEAVEEALSSGRGTAVYTFGPLIHNTAVLEKLASRGVRVLNDETLCRALESRDGSLSGAVAVIRAHGVPPEIRGLLELAGMTIVDATCPRVLANQKIAAMYSGRGYTVVLAGDRGHGEIAGIKGCAEAAGGTCVIVENRRDAEELAGYPEKAVLISQTTIKQSEYDEIASVLRDRVPDLRVCGTICPATVERQRSLEELCSRVDGVLVVGGRDSANTRRLLRTASALCARAALTENEHEIPPEFFELERIGITAGASTPDDVINAVEQALEKRYYKNKEC